MPIGGSEFLVLLVLAALLIGPERLPRYAEQVARLVRQLRQLASGAQSRIAAELGPEFQDVDWSQFDPRRYDPRRIVREALLEDLPSARTPPPGSARPQVPAEGSRSAAPEPFEPGASPAPFDDEAT